MTTSGKSGNNTLAVEIVTTLDRFSALAQEWEKLIDDAHIPHPFLSYAWLRTWWECFAQESDELRIILVRVEGRLVGAAPLALRRVRMYGVPVRTLESIYNDHTPRCEFPVCGDRYEQVYPLLWRALVEMPCDVIILKQFPAQSSTLAAVQAEATVAGWHCKTAPGATSPFILLERDPQSVLGRLSSRERYNLRKRLKDLRALGEVEFEQVSDPEQLAPALQDGLEIEAAAWKGQAGTAIASDPSVKEFYCKLAQRSAESGWLRLLFLTLDGRRISFAYVLDYRQTVFGVKVGYDPQYRKFAPGHALLSMTLQEACERGLTEYDLLGDDDPYKRIWTDQARTHTWLFVFRPNVMGTLLHALKFQLVPLGKRLRQLVTRRP